MKMHEEVEALAILFLSQVERAVSRPTVADLTAISEALGVSTAHFYNLSKPRSIRLLPAATPRAVPLRQPDGKAHPRALGLQLNSFTSQG